MRTYDFSPLWRSTIGFDRLFDLAAMAQRAGEDNYPPYNIERLAEDRYQISLAVAGLAPNDIAITAEQNVVTIEGSKPDKAERDFLYRGISTRNFKRQFNLADYIQVKSAAFDNGLLKIEAAPDRHQRRVGRQRTETGIQGGLAAARDGAARVFRAAAAYRQREGGSHAADDRRVHHNNIRRYRRLLATRLTELERAYIERRFNEERASAESLLREEFPDRLSARLADVDESATNPDMTALLHPSDAFSHPMDVVEDCDLTSYEKRAILSFWAADACAVKDLRDPSRTFHGAVSFDDILDALCALGSESQLRAECKPRSDPRCRKKKPETLNLCEIS